MYISDIPRDYYRKIGKNNQNTSNKNATNEDFKTLSIDDIKKSNMSFQEKIEAITSAQN